MIAPSSLFIVPTLIWDGWESCIPLLLMINSLCGMGLYSKFWLSHEHDGDPKYRCDSNGNKIKLSWWQYDETQHASWFNKVLAVTALPKPKASNTVTHTNKKREAFQLVRDSHGNLVFAFLFVFAWLVFTIMFVYEKNWYWYCSGKSYAKEDLVQNGYCFVRNITLHMLVMGLMYTFLTGIVLMWLLKDVVEGVRSEYKARVRDRYQGSVEIIDACLEIIENNIAKKRPTIDTMLTMPLPGAHYLKCKNAQLVPLQVPVLAILAVVLGVGVVIGPFWIRSDFLFEVKQNYGLVTVVFVICGFSAIVFGYVFGDVAIRVYSLYWVNYALMEAFCGAIYIKSADDIAAWSDLRKYFQYYEMLVNYQIGGKAFGVMILGLLFLSFYVLEDWVQTGGHIWRNTYSLSGVGALILIAAVLLMFSHAAASIYTVQRTQLSMLRQEQLRLKYLVTMKEKDEAAKCFELIEFLIQFIHDHDEKPRILGIEMTPTVLRVINGYIVTAVVAIIGNLITVA